MRFVDDENLSFCLTISTGIKRDDLLYILGRVEMLPEPKAFDDFVWETHQPGKKGLLNVFEDGDFLVTVENNGFLGVARRTVTKTADIPGISHYAAIYHSSGNAGYQYVETQDGTVVANFDPVLDEAPDAVADFFLGGEGNLATRYAMIDAVEYRMETSVLDEWLTQPTDTYVIDYRTDRN